MYTPFDFLPGDILLTRTRSSKINPSYQRLARLRQLATDQAIWKLNFTPTHAAIMFSTTLVAHSEKESTSHRRTSDDNGALYKTVAGAVKRYGVLNTIRRSSFTGLARRVLGHGVDVVPIDEFLAKKTPKNVLLIRIPELHQRATEITQKILYHLDKPYNIGIGFWSGDDTSAFCSQLVYELLLDLGVIKSSRPSHKILPVDLSIMALRNNWPIIKGEQIYPGLLHFSEKYMEPKIRGYYRANETIRVMDLIPVVGHRLVLEETEGVLEGAEVAALFLSQLETLSSAVMKLKGQNENDVREHIRTHPEIEFKLFGKSDSYSVDQLISWVETISVGAQEEKPSEDIDKPWSWRLAAYAKILADTREDKSSQIQRCEQSLANAVTKMDQFVVAHERARTLLEAFLAKHSINASDALTTEASKAILESEAFQVLNFTTCFFAQLQVQDIKAWMERIREMMRLFVEGVIEPRAQRIKSGDSSFPFEEELEKEFAKIENYSIAMDWALQTGWAAAVRQLCFAESSLDMLAACPITFLSALKGLGEQITESREGREARKQLWKNLLKQN
jgi:hypothetical protein